MIFVGAHSHRSKASAKDVATGRFARFEKVAEVADFLKQTAIPGELIL